MECQDIIQDVLCRIKAIKGVEDTYILNEEDKEKIFELEKKAEGAVLMGMGIGDNQGIKEVLKREIIIAFTTNMDYVWPEGPNVILMQYGEKIGEDISPNLSMASSITPLSHYSPLPIAAATQDREEDSRRKRFVLREVALWVQASGSGVRPAALMPAMAQVSSLSEVSPLMPTEPMMVPSPSRIRTPPATGTRRPPDAAARELTK